MDILGYGTATFAAKYRDRFAMAENRDAGGPSRTGSIMALFFWLLLGVTAPLAQSPDTQAACQIDSELKGSKEPAALAQLGRLKGTVAMAGNNTCSGALVTFKGRSSAAPALVLSAAHCSDRGSLQLPMGGKTLAALDAGEVLADVEYRRPLTLDTGNSETPRTCVQSDRIVYASLTDTDVMLLRLDETYDQIERRTGVRPFVVSDDTSFPERLALRLPSGLWQNDRFCEIEEMVRTVKEHRWLWSDVMRLRRMDPDTCLTPSGVSGSPLIRKDTNEVIGVLGTTNTESGIPCELHNPCEVKADGSVVAPAREQSYVHSVHKLYACLDAARNLDTRTPNCLLPRPRP